MSQELWSKVDTYICEQLVPSQPALDAALKASDAGGLPAIQVSAAQGKFLQMLVKIQGARRILELGTLGGYSTIWLTGGLPTDGRLVTVEFEETHAKVARANIANAGFASMVDLRVGAALDVLPQLAAEGGAPFDFIFIDADKDNYPSYLTWSLRLARPGTIIIADNVVRQGGVLEPQHPDVRVQGVRTFYEMVSSEPRLTATVLQTVGCKGYDGFAMAVVQ